MALIDELQEHIRQSRFVFPYVLHHETMVRDFNVGDLPLLFVTPEGRLEYLNDFPLLKGISFDFANTISADVLSRCEVIETFNILTLLKGIEDSNNQKPFEPIFGESSELGNTADKNNGNEISNFIMTELSGKNDDNQIKIAIESFFHLRCFIQMYEKYHQKKCEVVSDIHGLKDANLLVVPVYLFGVPRVVAVYPSLGRSEFVMMMSTLTTGLEVLLWDVFTKAVSSSIRNKMSLAEAFRQNLGILFPQTEWTGCGFSVSNKTLIPEHRHELEVIIPQTSGIFSNDLIARQNNLLNRLDRSAYTWSELRRTILKEVYRSAVAAIMGRNMSHNQGSHAIGYLAEDLQVKPAKYGNAHLSDFMRYIQKRMDFIAQIATTAPSWCLNFDWIDLTDQFSRQKCLLENIARSDKVVYPNKSETPQQRSDRLADNMGRLSIRVVSPQQEGGTKPFYIDVPHGPIGAHAFYSTLENLIRNTAKYGTAKEAVMGARHIEVTLQLEDIWEDSSSPDEAERWQEDFYRVTIRDNEYVDAALGENEEELKLRRQFFAESLPARQVKADEAARMLNEYLREPIVDPGTAELRPGHWGIKEIKICAAYLRLIPQENIDHRFEELSLRHADQPPIVEVRAVDGQLEYVLYLLRPKSTLFVDVTPPSPDWEANARKAGIDFWSLKSLKDRLDAGSLPRHEFVVFALDQKRLPWFVENRNLLPHRVFVFDACAELLTKVPDYILRTVKQLLPESLRSNPAEQKAELWRAWVESEYCDSPMRTSEYHQESPLIIRWRAKPGFASSLIRFEDNNTFIDGVTGAFVYDHYDGPEYKIDEAMCGPAYELYKTAFFHECLDSGSVVRTLIDDMIDADELSLQATEAIWRIKEASALSIAILDERIYEKKNQKRSGKGTEKYSEGLSFEQAWRKRRVYLLDADRAVEGLSKFSNRQPSRILWKDNPQLRQDNCFDFLVVHQGILDKIRDAEGIEVFEAGWRELKAKARHVVITTGRGRPETARKETLRWIEFSNLSEAVSRGSKADLATLLFALQAEQSKTEQQ